MTYFIAVIAAAFVAGALVSWLGSRIEYRAGYRIDLVKKQQHDFVVSLGLYITGFGVATTIFAVWPDNVTEFVSACLLVVGAILLFVSRAAGLPEERKGLTVIGSALIVAGLLMLVLYKITGYSPLQ